jgi:acetoin utilization protein AcuB
MYVGLKMLRDFTKATPAMLVTDADRLLEEKGLWMLLVMEGEKLVGYVRREDVKAALPSPATSLDRHELGYLLSRLTVSEIMRTDITTIAPEAEIEKAAQVMDDKRLHGLAVVDGAGKVIGYINRTVMLEVLVEEMGLGMGGVRLAFEVEDRPGVIHEATGVVREQGVSIISVSTFYHDERRMVVFRLKTGEASAVGAALAERGFVPVAAADFEQEWSG